MAKTVTAKPLIISQYAQNSNTNEYTTPSSTKTIIDKFTVTNISGGSVSINIYLVPSGQSAGDEYLIIDTLSVAANATQDITELKNHVLDTGDLIVAGASAADSLVIRCSGREVVTS